MISTKLPNPIRKTRVLKRVLITEPCLKFWVLYTVYTVYTNSVPYHTRQLFWYRHTHDVSVPEYCSVKDCFSMFLCEYVILHFVKEQWLTLVKWKKKFSKPHIQSAFWKKIATEIPMGNSYGTMLCLQI